MGNASSSQDHLPNTPDQTKAAVCYILSSDGKSSGTGILVDGHGLIPDGCFNDAAPPSLVSGLIPGVATKKQRRFIVTSHQVIQDREAAALCSVVFGFNEGDTPPLDMAVGSHSPLAWDTAALSQWLGGLPYAGCAQAAGGICKSEVDGKVFGRCLSTPQGFRDDFIPMLTGLGGVDPVVDGVGIAEEWDKALLRAESGRTRVALRPDEGFWSVADHSCGVDFCICACDPAAVAHITPVPVSRGGEPKGASGGDLLDIWQHSDGKPLRGVSPPAQSVSAKVVSSCLKCEEDECPPALYHAVSKFQISSLSPGSPIFKQRGEPYELVGVHYRRAICRQGDSLISCSSRPSAIFSYLHSRCLAEVMKRWRNFVVNTPCGLFCDLNQRGLTDEDCPYIVTFMHERPDVRTYQLNENGIGKAGCCMIAQALSDGVQITALELDGNAVGDVGGQALADVIPHTKLERIHVRGNNLSPETKEMLRQAWSGAKKPVCTPGLTALPSL